MIIGGMQKLTLLDYPGRVAATVFFAGCDFRCPFCHNASLVLPERIGQGPTVTADDVLAYLRMRKGMLEGVCLTGGEPLAQPGLDGFIRDIRSLGLAVKLDTNGSYPDRMKELAGQGLIDYVAMDVKNGPSRYAATAGTAVDMGAIKDSVSWLLAGRVPFEFRTTVAAPLFDDGCFDEIGRWLTGAPRYWLQGFNDSGDLIADGLTAYDRPAMEHFLEIVRRYIPQAALRGMD